jgi:NMD protein affecting ribosome stability and mRNA decay
MYPDSKDELCIDVYLGEGYVSLCSDILFTEATETDVLTLLAQTKLTTCPRCGKPAFDPTVHETNRGGLCEECFVDDLNDEIEKEQKKEEVRQKRSDSRMRKKGYSHRTNAWIHPKSGGSDYIIEIYSRRELSKEAISTLLLKEGSTKPDAFIQVSL